MGAINTNVGNKCLVQPSFYMCIHSVKQENTPMLLPNMLRKKITGENGSGQKQIIKKCCNKGYLLLQLLVCIYGEKTFTEAIKIENRLLKSLHNSGKLN